MEEGEIVLIGKAFSDLNRLHILQHLMQGELCACKLLERLQITQPIMGPLSRPLPKILRVPSDRTVLSSEAPKVELIRNLIA